METQYAIFDVRDRILWHGKDKEEAIRVAKEKSERKIVTLYEMKEIDFVKWNAGKAVKK